MNNNTSPIRQAQLQLLDMLRYIDTVCRKENISYRLDSGNVIGAVRHKGFIPWDDDVDIALSPDNYRRLCRYLLLNPHPRYKLQSPETDPLYLLPWNKLRDTHSEYIPRYAPGSKEMKAFERQCYKGLQIDIFPFRDRMLPPLQRLAGKMACLAAFDLSPRHPRLARTLFRFNARVAFPLFRLAGKIVGNPQTVMHDYGTWFYRKYQKKHLIPYKLATFEGLQLPVPACTHEFLTLLYGNYSELPPPQQRQWHAQNIVFFE